MVSLMPTVHVKCQNVYATCPQRTSAEIAEAPLAVDSGWVLRDTHAALQMHDSDLHSMGVQKVNVHRGPAYHEDY